MQKNGQRSTVNGQLSGAFTLIELLVACHPKPRRRKAIPTGFTLIELLVVMGIFAIMIGLASINLLHPQTQANLDTTVTTLISGLREQQIRAMSGDGPSDYGINFEPNRYTLFTGSNPSQNPASNFVVDMQGAVTISTNPSIPTYIVFAQRSGQTSQTTALTVTNTNSNESKTITINILGAVSIQ